MQFAAVRDISKDAARAYSEDKIPRMAAALAYYTLLSAAPLLIIAVAIAGLVFGREAVQAEAVQQLQSLMGSQGGELAQSMLASTSTGGGVAGTVVGIVLLLIGASGVFAELQDSLNTIWGVRPKPGRSTWTKIRERFLSLLAVLGTGLLLFVTLLISTALGALTRFAGLAGAGAAGFIVDLVTTIVVGMLLFAMIYRLLPDVKITWRDVWVGALLTAVLFAVGKLLIGLYLGHASVGSAFGAAGSVVVFVVWVYYSMQILLIGAELTKSYADRFGSRIRPAPNAEPVTAEARAQQGLSPNPNVGARGNADSHGRAAV